MFLLLRLFERWFSILISLAFFAHFFSRSPLQISQEGGGGGSFPNHENKKRTTTRMVRLEGITLGYFPRMVDTHLFSTGSSSLLCSWGSLKVVHAIILYMSSLADEIVLIFVIYHFYAKKTQLEGGACFCYC